jgi:hypothetical protein
MLAAVSSIDGRNLYISFRPGFLSSALVSPFF